MSKTILHEYERLLDERIKRGEIVESTRNTYLNDASRVFEVLLKSLPPGTIEEHMKAEGYRGRYRHVIESLHGLVRPKRQTAFPTQPEEQPRLLDV